MKPFITALLIGLAACSTSVTPDPLHVSINSVRTIGVLSEEADDTQMFGFVSAITLDADENVYVFDGRSVQFKVYDAGGRFLRQFGERGQGPGELQTLTAAVIDRKGRLIVADHGQARISLFDTQGQFLESKPSPLRAARITQITELPDGTFLLAGHHNQKLIHIVDASFSDIIASLVDASDMLYTDNPLELSWLQFYPGSGQPLADGRIVYIPAIYNGKGYLYEEKTGWEKTGELGGMDVLDTPVTFGKPADLKRMDVPFVTPDGRFGAQFHAFSLGLIPVGGQHIAHFSYREVRDGILLFSEMIRNDGFYEGYFVADSLGERQGLSVMFRDSGPSGTVYASDHREYPKVRMYEISGL